MPIRAEGWITRRGAGSSTPPGTSSTRRPAPSSPRRRAIYVAAGAQRKQRAPRALRHPPSSADEPTDGWPHDRSTADADGTPTAARAEPSRATAAARAVAFVAAHRDAAEALGASLAELHQRPGRVREGADRAVCDARRPRVPGRTAARRARASAPSTASAGRSWRLSTRGFRNATKRRPPDDAPLHRRPPLPRAASSRPAGSPSGSSSARSPVDTERTWQLLRRAAREAGDWITVDSLAHPYGKGIARRAVPLGRARAARLQPVALGAPTGRLDDRHDAPRRPRRGAATPGRRPRPAAPRPA